MSMLVKNGDYVPDGMGGFVESTGHEALLQRVLFRLMARRGAFPLLPKIGSRLFCLPSERASRRAALAKDYVEEALAEEEGLQVEEVQWNAQSGELVALLRYREQTLRVNLTPTEKGGLF